MIAELSGALSAISVLKTTIGAVTAVHDATKLAELKLSLLEKALALQDQLQELREVISSDRDRIDELQKEIAGLVAEQAQRGEMALVEVGPSKHRAWKVTPTSEGKPYWLCPACFTGGKRSLLQPRTGNNHRLLLRCSVETKHFVLIDREQEAPDLPRSAGSRTFGY